MARRELDLNPEQIRYLEETIFSARNYVRPTDDLRPRTLEAAKESNRLQTNANRLVVGVLGVLLVWSVLVSAASALSIYRDRIAGPFPVEIQQAAERYSAGNHYEIQWGMVDAFQDSRSLEAMPFRSAGHIVSDH